MARKINRTDSAGTQNGKGKCLCCCHEKNITRDYYKSSSPYYDGHLPWCKECTKKILSDMIEEMGSGSFEVGFFYFCRIADIPYYYNKVSDIEDKTPDSFIGAYLSKITTAKMGKGVRFADGDIRSESDIRDLVKALDVIDGKTEPVEDEFEITDEMRRMWKNPSYEGRKDFYKILWEHYRELRTRYPDADDKQQLHFPRLADLNLKIETSSWDPAKIDDYEKYTRMYMKNFDMAGLSSKGSEKKNEGDLPLCSIVSICEDDGFVEPWDFVKPYNHRKDDIYFAELDMLNTYLENHGQERVDELPRLFNHDSRLDVYTEEELRKADDSDSDDSIADILKAANDANNESDRR